MHQTSQTIRLQQQFISSIQYDEIEKLCVCTLNTATDENKMCYYVIHKQNNRTTETNKRSSNFYRAPA